MAASKKYQIRDPRNILRSEFCYDVQIKDKLPLYWPVRVKISGYMNMVVTGKLKLRVEVLVQNLPA